MKQYTYGEIRTQVSNALDLTNETNIAADEMVGYCNESVLQAYSEILKLRDDYFLSSSTINLVNGTAQYSLPSNIFASKILGVIYDNGAGIIYPVRQMTQRQRWEKFVDVAITNYFGPTIDYRYQIFNDSSTAGYKFVLVPPSRETGASYIKIWFSRTANLVPLVSAGSQAASDATVVDIPEFYTFVMAYMKMLCLGKEGADPRLPQYVALVESQRKMMVDTLTQMIPDDDDQIVPDMTFYSDHE